MAFPMVVLSVQENCIVAIIKLTARKKKKQLPLPSHIIIVQNERHYKTSRQTKAEKKEHPRTNAVQLRLAQWKID